MRDSTERFSTRVDDYVRARPGYPIDLVRAIDGAVGLSPETIVADIGAGTGISTALFLAHGGTVFAVEPNAAMREAAVAKFGATAGFHPIEGTAERTTLAAGAVDLVVAGQAFHWFDRERAHREFHRILRPGGVVALFWNDRLTDRSPFLQDYEQLLEAFGTDYREVVHRNVTLDVLSAFFGGAYDTMRFTNAQSLDFEGLSARLLSSSYTPAPGDARREPMLRELRRIFDVHQQQGRVQLLYETRLHMGRLTVGDRPPDA